MNIVELSEKNIAEAKNLFVIAKGEFFNAMDRDAEIIDIGQYLLPQSDSFVTYMLADKGVYQSLVTLNKSTATIENLWINFGIAEDMYLSKFLEFAIKQFSAQPLVFYWVESTDEKVTRLIENYGFDYTGEQAYVDKERNISKFRYVYRRKK